MASPRKRPRHKCLDFRRHIPDFNARHALGNTVTRAIGNARHDLGNTITFALLRRGHAVANFIAVDSIAHLNWRHLIRKTFFRD